jgi:hypothetical protein
VAAIAGSAALGLSRELRTRPVRIGHARHGGDRSNTTCSYVSSISQTSSTSSLTTCDLVSQWRQFLRSQAEAILACDFFTADLLDGTQAYVLAVIEHATRRIRILGVTLRVRIR